MLQLERAFDLVLGLAAPQRCAGCCAFGDVLCSACQSTLWRTPLPPPIVLAGGITAHAAGSYAGTLRSAILALKFRGFSRLTAVLAQLICARVPIAADHLMGVPLHAGRLRARGFDQALLLAHALSAWSGIPVLDDAVVRSQATLPQSRLTKAARAANLRLAFSEGPACGAVAGKSIALVDDVLTTGATLAACAAVLRRGGAARIQAVVAARRL